MPVTLVEVLLRSVTLPCGCTSDGFVGDTGLIVGFIGEAGLIVGFIGDAGLMVGFAEKDLGLVGGFVGTVDLAIAVKKHK